MLVIGRTSGKKVLIGNHSVVTVVGVDHDTVRLGFDTRDEVQRVDSPTVVLEAAKAEIRAGRKLTSKLAPMEHYGVFVSVGQGKDGSPRIVASMDSTTVSRYGHDVSTVNDTTTTGPPNHQFVMVRCMSNHESEVLQRLSKGGILPWKFYENMEAYDTTVYALFVAAVPMATQGDDPLPDVKYVDLV